MPAKSRSRIWGRNITTSEAYRPETPRELFVALEGVEGAGKTTQAALLEEWLTREGIAFTLAREPGGTDVGEAIRTVVQDRPELEVPAETELLLYLASRAAFVRQVVRPALERGDLVIADRFSMSTYAYQGYGRGLELEAVKAMDRFATGGLVPSLYLIFDVPVEAGRRRQQASNQSDDRIEQAGPALLERVRKGYLEMAEHDPTAHIIDASKSAAEVHTAVQDVIRDSFPQAFAGGAV